MKVVVVVGSYPADTGHLSDLARVVRLTVYGSLAAMPWYTHEVEPPRECRSRTFVPVGRIHKGHSGWMYPGLWSALDEDQPDIVHVVSEPWGLLALQTARWANRRRFHGLVLHGCDQHWWHGQNDVKRFTRVRLARYALAAARGFAGENQGAVHESEVGGLPEGSPTAVIHTNPRDPDMFRPPGGAAERIAARDRFGLPRLGVGVGFMGRLVSEKGAELFVDAWQSARDLLDEPAFAVVAGSGSLDVLLREQADNQLRFLGSLTFPTEVADFFRAIDVLVHPPWRTPVWAEQSPRVLLEAMLSGCVIVATDSGANTEVLQGEGFVVPERDLPALEVAIAEAVAVSSRMGRDQQARSHAIAVYSHRAVARKLQILWADVLERERLG